MRVFLVLVLAIALVTGTLGLDTLPVAAGAMATTGGIEPVSPQEFAGKLGSLGDSFHDAASPLVDALAKLGISLSAVLLILVLVLGRTLIARVIGGLLTIALGILLWYGAPYIVGVIKGIWSLLFMH